MSEQRKKYQDMSKEEIEKEYIMCMLSNLSDEKLDLMLMLARALTDNNYDNMPESALEFFASDEKASEETKEKARIALAKKRGEAVECCR